jgi:hypothetical protein
MKAKAPYVTGILVLFASWHLRAQDTAAQRHEMATNQLKRLAAEMTAQCLSGIRTLDEWKKQQPESRRQLLDMLGLDPLPKRTPLKARITASSNATRIELRRLCFKVCRTCTSPEIFTCRQARPKRCPPSCIYAAIRRILLEQSFNIRTGLFGSRLTDLPVWFSTRMSSANWPAFITALTT